MAKPYMNARRARVHAIEQAIPVSFIRRCFIQAVVISNVPGIEDMTDDEKPRFEEVAGEGDIITHNILFKYEIQPFRDLGLGDRAIQSSVDEVILLRERVMRPYGKMTIFAANQTCYAVLQWLVDNGLFRLDDKPELLDVIERVKDVVKECNKKQWASLQAGAIRTATFILAALAKEGFGYGLTEQDWREACNASD
jgi:hypothetical protein